VIGCVYNNGDLAKFLGTHVRQSIGLVLNWTFEIVDAVMANDLTVRLIDVGAAVALLRADRRDVKRVFAIHFSRCPAEERSRDRLNLREDVPLSVIETLGEESKLTDIRTKMEDPRVETGPTEKL
jgi:hypothetical protein